MGGGVFFRKKVAIGLVLPSCHLLVDFRIQFHLELPVSEAPSLIFHSHATLLPLVTVGSPFFCNSRQEFSLSPSWEGGMSLLWISVSLRVTIWRLVIAHFGDRKELREKKNKPSLQASLLLMHQSLSCASVLLALEVYVTLLCSQSGDSFL